jgi:hypothetical protein
MEGAYLLDGPEIGLTVREVASFRFLAKNALIFLGVPWAQLRQSVVLYLRLGMLSMWGSNILVEIKFHYIGLYFYKF